MMTRLLISCCMIASIVLLTLAPTQAQSGDTYESRRANLLSQVAAPFVDDPQRTAPETALDKRSFDAINKLACPKPLDNPNGWSIELRTGGRPFLNFDTITIIGNTPSPQRCTEGESGIPLTEINQHYDAGRGVNRLHFVHPYYTDVPTNTKIAGYPIVLAMTPDGFFNPAGPTSPQLMGAVGRFGFIGEPYSALDYLQHVDDVRVTTIDDQNLRILYSIHSAAGAGVLEFILSWDEVAQQPRLHFRSAHTPRASVVGDAPHLGFAGLNFMRGPTLWGLQNSAGTPSGGIEAFHDACNIFLVEHTGAVIQDLLIPPYEPGIQNADRVTLREGVPIGSRLIADQPQDVTGYFSRTPKPAYDERADLLLDLRSSTVEPIQLRRAQVAVDLTDANAEANETINAFFTANLKAGRVDEFSYGLAVASANYPSLYGTHHQGIAFVSDRNKGIGRIYFQELDTNLQPVGEPMPLTDAVTSDPHHPAASPDGRYLIFDADDYKQSDRQRIYTLDIATGAVRRLTVDPFGSSSDASPAFNSDRSRFLLITNRSGTGRLNLEAISTGLGSGIGTSLAPATTADWCHSRDLITFADTTGLKLRETDGTIKPLHTQANVRSLQFSPDCSFVAYVADTNLRMISIDGSGDKLVLDQVDHVGWMDLQHLVIERLVDTTNHELFVLNLQSNSLTRLTNAPGFDGEPVFVTGFRRGTLYLPTIRR